MISTLLVDDNEAFVAVAGETLRHRFGSQVALVGIATDGEQALLKAVALRPRLVLIDLIMPGLSGLQVIPTLREHSPQSWIIGLSVRDDEASRRAGLDAGAHFIIGKSQLGSALPAMLLELAANPPPA